MFIHGEGKMKKEIAVDLVAKKILLIRGLKVMLDSDLAELYGVKTKELNKAVQRNKNRFPRDFMFRLTEKRAGGFEEPKSRSR
jgi:hypothetical protein